MILSCEEGHWYGRGLELPHVFGDGKTVKQCMEDTREALCGAVAVMLEQGPETPAPAREGTRTHRSTSGLTAEEKALLEGTAKQRGYRGSPTSSAPWRLNRPGKPAFLKVGRTGLPDVAAAGESQPANNG